MKTVIRFTQVNKKQRLTRQVWVKSASFQDGPGFRVKSVVFTPDRNQAAQFSSFTALAVAEQYFFHSVRLEFVDGTPNVDLTAALVRSQMANASNYNEMVRKSNQEWREFMEEVLVFVPELRKLLGRV